MLVVDFQLHRRVRSVHQVAVHHKVQHLQRTREALAKALSTTFVAMSLTRSTAASGESARSPSSSTHTGRGCAVGEEKRTATVSHS